MVGKRGENKLIDVRVRRERGERVGEREKRESEIMEDRRNSSLFR